MKSRMRGKADEELDKREERKIKMKLKETRKRALGTRDEEQDEREGR